MSYRVTNRLKLGLVTAATAALISVGSVTPGFAATSDVQPMGLNGPYSTEENCNAAREQHPQYPHVGECEFTSFGPGVGWWWGFYS